MNQCVWDVLKEKADLLDRNKEYSIRETGRRIGELIHTLEIIENNLLEKASTIFDQNKYAEALSLQDDETPENRRRAEEISRMPVPEPIYPTDEELQSTKDALHELLEIMCPIPKNGRVETNSPATITFTWDNMPRATGYKAEMKGPREKAFHEIYSGRGTSTTVRSLSVEGEYQMRVRALYGNEASGWSGVVLARPWFLEVPQNITASSKGSDEIQVVWEGRGVPIGKTVNYEIEIQSRGTLGFLKTYTQSRTFFSEKDFEPLREYSIRICTILGTTRSGWSGTVTVKTQGPKCLMGHEMLPYTMNEVYTKYRYEGMICDFCLKKFSRAYQGILYGCRACNYDICFECSKKSREPPKMKCRNGHDLALVTLSQRIGRRQIPGVKCDLCRKFISVLCVPSYPVLFCRECNYDVCNECAQKYK